MAVFTKTEKRVVVDDLPSAPEPVRRTVAPSACCVPGCDSCLPHRVAHWKCAQCGGGPFKFSATDPGKYKILRPHFERTHQEYVMNAEGIGRWKYDVRRVCSPGCWQKEARRVSQDEMQLAQERPDLAPAIQAKVEAEQDLDAAEYQDDLVPDPGQF